MFEVNKTRDRITVSVKLPRRKRAKDPCVSVNTQKVLDFLNEKGYPLKGYMLESFENCCNTHEEDTREGEWTWSKPEKKVEKNVRKTQSTKRRRITKTPITTKED